MYRSLNTTPRNTAQAMSDLDRARDMYDAWNEGNVDRIIDFWWDDATWEESPEVPDREIVHGRENVEARLRELIEVMGDLQMEVIELEQLGDEVLGSVQVRVVGSTSGVTIETSAFHLIRFERGRVRRYRNFTTREQAHEAAESS
jgi:ketosteroid isomerase-like protein